MINTMLSLDAMDVKTVLMGLAVMYVVYMLVAGRGSSGPGKQVKIVKRDGKYTKEQVAEHCSADDAWLIIDGKVYDITDYVDSHAGGDAILRNVGKDASVGFHGPQHGHSTADILPEYLIGTLVKS